MATQHPDNAMPTYWSNKEFVNTYEEIEECYRMFKDLGVDEYMWDWEGKFVDESVIDKLFRDYYEYFKKNKLGKDKFLTFRIPNIWTEKGYRLARAFMGILTASEISFDLGFNTHPIFEVILPMTTKESQIIHIGELFRKVSKFKKDVFGSSKGMIEKINVIPLLEEVGLMINTYSFLDHYCTEYKKKFKESLTDIRLFLARSDPALNSGIISSVLGAKIAISECRRFEKEKGVNIYPWLGAGSLPFRGGVNPDNLKNVLKEYAGLDTITVQSAFRYDYPKSTVKKAISYINEEIPKNREKYVNIDKREIEILKKIMTFSIKEYTKTIEGIEKEINLIADKVPARRERVLHVGLFGYSRGVGKVRLPRAIKFTAALYSLGVPPEIISTGRTLKFIRENFGFELFNKVYKYFREDLIHASHYINLENLEMLSKKNKSWLDVKEDMKEISDYLGQDLGPKTTHHYIHRNLVSSVYYKMLKNEDFTLELVEAAKIRKSLG